jgi:hypothetical protein
MVHPDALTFAIREVMSRHCACRNCYCGEVEERQPDARGCNWTVSVVAGPGSGACLLAILPSIHRLKERFCVGYSDEAKHAVDLLDLMYSEPGEPPDA